MPEAEFRSCPEANQGQLRSAGAQGPVPWAAVGRVVLAGPRREQAANEL
jgi:hypothetical protein